MTQSCGVAVPLVLQLSPARNEVSSAEDGNSRAGCSTLEVGCFPLWGCSLASSGNEVKKM